jgi:hypothetical protein
LIRWPKGSREEQGGAPPPGPSLAAELHHSPGLEAAFRRMRAVEGGRVLDLGPAVRTNVEFFASFAHHLRIVDVLAPSGTFGIGEGGGSPPVIDPAWGPFDLVLAWDLLSSLEPAEARARIDQVERACLRGACLFALVVEGDAAAIRPSSFAIRDEHTLEYRYPARPEPTRAWTPAAVQRALEPFRVEHSFVLRNGFHEYAAVLE